MDLSINGVLLYHVYAARDDEGTPEQPKYRLIADFQFEEDAKKYIEYLKANPHDHLYKYFLRDAGK